MMTQVNMRDVNLGFKCTFFLSKSASLPSCCSCAGTHGAWELQQRRAGPHECLELHSVSGCLHHSVHQTPTWEFTHSSVAAFINARPLFAVRCEHKCVKRMQSLEQDKSVQEGVNKISNSSSKP